MAKKLNQKAKTKKVDLAPKTATKKRNRLTGFKKSSPLFGQIRRLKGEDKIAKPGPKKGKGRLSEDEKKAAKQEQKEVLRLRKQLKETLETRKEEEIDAYSKWEQKKKTLTKKEIAKQISDARKKLMATFKEQLGWWLKLFGPPSPARQDRVESDVKFMFKYPDNPEPVWRP